MNKKGKPSIIRWRGLLYDLSQKQRALTFVSIAVLIASLSFTQLGFVGVGLLGNFTGYCVILLAPIAFGALLIGVLPGTVLGFLAGVVLFVHSQVQPLDYYEMSFITPFSSIVLFTAVAFFTSLFLAIALRKNPPLRRRIVYFAIVSIIVSVMFTVTFMLNVIFQIVIQLVEIVDQTDVELSQDAMRGFAAAKTGRLGSTELQIVVDAALMFAACVIGELSVRKFRAAEGKFTLGSRFRSWLMLVVSLAFVVVAGVGFVVITEQSKSAASENMQGEMVYLENQLRASDMRKEKLEELIRLDARSDKALSESEKAKLEAVFAYENLLTGYTKEENGIIVVFLDDAVLCSDDPKYEVGTQVSEYVGFPYLQEAVSDNLALDDSMVQIAYDENMLTKEDAEATDFMDLMMRTISTQMAFVCFDKYGDYTIMIILPATKVFSGRNATMAWVSLAALVLLVAVFLLVSRLLSVVVVSRINEANGVLGEITDGNLNARVNIRDSVEFSSLSTGINTTVDALKGWIAEAEQRMDTELATAKAIQESALPRIFPPYPDILKFDIYAIMNAARKVGGDFYDFFLIGDNAGPDGGKLGFIVADVSGKGVPAALFMMKANTQLRDYLKSGMEPGEAVENANRQLCDGNEEGMFVTAWIGVLDYATGHVDYVNAGHNPPLLWTSGKKPEEEYGEGESDKQPGQGSWRWLTNKSGLPLGLFDGLPYESYSVECQTGDQFLLYTDGVTEAMSVAGDLYGEDRLLEVADRHFASHPRALVKAVRHDVARHAKGAEQSDDITVLALEVGVPPEVTAIINVPADDTMLPVVNDFIHTELDRRLCPLRAQKQLDVAVEELFVNVCHYAYSERNTSGRTVRIGYTYSAEPPSVKVTIADDGVPYNPLEKPDAVTPDDIMDVPIGGLGILMAKRSVDEMTYERVDGSNVVTIVKKW